MILRGFAERVRALSVVVQRSNLRRNSGKWEWQDYLYTEVVFCRLHYKLERAFGENLGSPAVPLVSGIQL